MVPIIRIFSRPVRGCLYPARYEHIVCDSSWLAHAQWSLVSYRRRCRALLIITGHPVSLCVDCIECCMRCECVELYAVSPSPLGGAGVCLCRRSTAPVDAASEQTGNRTFTQTTAGTASQSIHSCIQGGTTHLLQFPRYGCFPRGFVHPVQR